MQSHRDRYHRAKRRATPAWLTREQRKEIATIYRRMRWLNGAPGFTRCDLQLRYVVDHIVPLLSGTVSGLHVPWNLRVVPYLANARKSNHMWPGHPYESLPMFPEYEPQQLSLGI